jgi:hypothetical membrane protein
MTWLFPDVSLKEKGDWYSFGENEISCLGVHDETVINGYENYWVISFYAVCHWNQRLG